MLFLLISVPQEGGTVVLNTGIPGVEFYLDGTFVAVTDENGTLTIENLPAGSFSYVVAKRGYAKYQNSFSIKDGETRRLSPVMERIRAVADPDQKSAGPFRPSRAQAKKMKAAQSAELSAAEAQQPPVQIPPAAAPVAADAPEQADPQDSQALSPAYILIFLFLIASAGIFIWIRTKKRAEAPMPPLESTAEIEPPRKPSDASNRPNPEFIEELRRREELLNAGFVGNNPRVVDRESMKEKEVVIVLPKEAFRYEDDK
ncbi:MAG: hypothetical protein JXA73_01840 [Acidobacteria bacterium]|nr:hypothetical protein [Acidobacteriota bacterium]